MPVTVSLSRPPSQLAKLEAKIKKAAPKGLPKDVRAFYAAGDGLVVDRTSGKTKERASIVGLAEMFDGTFKPHQLVTKPIDDVTGRPFADRFFNDDFEFDGPDALARFNVLLRLKLVASVPGESVDIAIDLFDATGPVLYVIHRLTPLRLEGLTFDEFVANFSRFGLARWYYAFLELSADDELNIDVAKAFTDSMRDFPAKDVAPLKKRLAERAKALAAYRKQCAAAANKAEGEAAKPANASKAAIAEIKKEAADAKYRLLILGDPDALVAGIRTKQLPPVVAWSYAEGLRVLPADLVPAVLAAKRDKRQDALLWARVEQLVGVTIPPGTKLDPLLADAASVAAIFRGDKAKVPARYANALGDWLYTPPREARLPGTPERPNAAKIKGEAAYARAVASYERDRLAALGAALVGAAKLTAALEKAYADTLYDRNLRYAPGALLLAGKRVAFDDIGNIALKTSDHGTLLELAATKKWSGVKLRTEADRLEPMGFQVDVLRWVANSLARRRIA